MTVAMTATAILVALLALWGAVEIVRAQLWELAPLVLACLLLAAVAGAMATAT